MKKSLSSRLLDDIVNAVKNGHIFMNLTFFRAAEEVETEKLFVFLINPKFAHEFANSMSMSISISICNCENCYII